MASNPEVEHLKQVEYLSNSNTQLDESGKPQIHIDELVPRTHGLTWSGSNPTIPQLGKQSHTVVDSKGKEVELPKGRMTCVLALTAFAAAFGSSFPHGWNTGVMNAPEMLINEFLNESYTERIGSPPSEAVLTLLWSASVAIYLIGGCAGAFAAGWFADFFGRKKALLVTYIFNFIGAVLFGFCDMANSFEMLYLARLIVGFGCGAGSGLVPMYLTEVAPVDKRGAMGVIHQFALTIGILVSQVMGLRQLLGNDLLWPMLLACTGVPSIVSLFILPCMPDSPRYLLVNKGDEEAAANALERFRGTDDVHAELKEIKMEQEQAELEPAWTFTQLLRSAELRMPLILVCSLAACQQLSGINAVFYYSAGVFETSGIPVDMVQYAVLGTGIINVLMTAISIPLMEKLGRRPLLLGGMAVMVLSDIVITIALVLQGTVTFLSYVCIICIITVVIGFAIGLGSIPQFIGAELFKQGPRPPAMSLAGFLNWLSNFLIAIFFPTMQQGLGPYSFIVFIFIVLAFGIFFFLKLPETKNKSYEEIFQIFNKGHVDITTTDKAPTHFGNPEETTTLLLSSANAHELTETSYKNGAGTSAKLAAKYRVE